MTAETAVPLVANRYRLHSVIGSGAVGRVWRGEDTVLRRAVAVKEVPLPGHLPDIDRESLRARVLREAQAAARIHHPGSVQVFDVVDESDRVYLVMELVDELTLAEVVSTDGPLTPAATAAIGAKLLGALAAAHEVGIVHRDVKPRNVMVLPSGDVKLADFGIASLRDDPSLTKTGMVLGTPSYMSPEQALGEGAGPASDLWGTGALLYFAVEGEPPFDRGEPIATLHAVVHDEPRPSARAGAIGPVITDLLAKDPTQRPELAGAKARLEAIAAGAGSGAAADNERTVALAAAATRAAPAAAPLPVANSRPPATSAAGPRLGTSRPSTSDRRFPVGAVAAIAALLVFGAILLSQVVVDDTTTDAGDTAPDATASTSPAAAPSSSTPQTATTEGTDPAGEGEETAPADDAGTEANSGEVEDDEEEKGKEEEEKEEKEKEKEDEGRDAEGTTGAPAQAPGRPGGVPASWVPYTEPEVGWTIWQPAGWQVAPPSGNAVDVRDPATGDYLRVDYVQPPGDDAAAAWRESSKRFAARYPDYEEIRIEPMTYQGYEAAIWEYTYQGQRATNIGIVTPVTGYALNFQTADSRWDERQDVRAAFEASFTIPR